MNFKKILYLLFVVFVLLSFCVFIMPSKVIADLARCSLWVKFDSEGELADMGCNDSPNCNVDCEIQSVSSPFMDKWWFCICPNSQEPGGCQGQLHYNNLSRTYSFSCLGFCEDQAELCLVINEELPGGYTLVYCDCTQ